MAKLENQITIENTYIFDIKLAITTFNKILTFIKQYNFSIPNYICLPDLYVFARAYRDKKMKSVLNNSLLTLADGKPLQFFVKLKTSKSLETISGYWLIVE